MNRHLSHHLRRSFADPDNITRDEFDELIGEAKEGTRPENAFALGGAEALRKAFTSDDVDPEVEKERHRHRFEDTKSRIFSVASAENLQNLQKMEEQAQLGLAAGEEVHNVPIGKLAADLKSDLNKGLTSPYATQRLAEDGPNELEKPPRVSFWTLFLIQLTQLIIVLLMGAAIASAVISASDGERNDDPLSYIDAIAIFIIVFLNAGIAASTENAANGALEALDALSAPATRCLRDGEEVEVESSTLVVGDVVLLSVGDIVPADCALTAF